MQQINGFALQRRQTRGATVAGWRRSGSATPQYSGIMTNSKVGCRIKPYARRSCAMMPSDEAARLLSILDELIALLRESDETHWSAWLEQDRRLIANGDFYGVEHLLRAFGGMGSFNDVALGEAEKNAKLDVLRGALYDCAATVKKTRERT